MLGITLIKPVYAVTWQELAPRASGIFLAEVISIVEQDDRPGDGDLYDEISLRVIRTTGNSRTKIYIIKGHGGHPYPDAAPPPPPKLQLAPGDLVVGKAYWFVNPSDQDTGYPSLVSGWWPRGDSLVDGVFDEAIRGDVLRWAPTFDPSTGLTYGLLTDPAHKTWQARVWNEDRVLWTRVFNGEKTGEWFLVPEASYSEDYKPPGLPKSTLILTAENYEDMPEANDWGIPAGTYYVHYLLEARNGRTLGAIVANRAGILRFRAYDRKGKVVFERPKLTR